MKDKLLKMLAAKQEARNAATAKSQASEDVAELRGLNAELHALDAEIRSIEGMLKDITDEEARGTNGDPEAVADPIVEARAGAPSEKQVMASFGMGMSQEERAAVAKTYEQRGANLRTKQPIVVSLEETPEERAVTLASGQLIVQKKYSNTLNEAFNEVSSLIDRVSAIPLMGGESYTKGFEISSGEGDYSTETGAYTDSDQVTAYVEVGKAKITAYTEITDEAQKLPNVDYQALVVSNVRKAIRKKITKQILIGAGGTNKLTGIINAPVAVMPTASNLEFDTIDADTLDTIVLGYGGDEDVEGGAYLIINKKTLKNFAAVRSTDGKKLYKITINADGNTGNISSEDSWNVPYILNSALAGFDTVTEDRAFGVYGKLMAYEMPVFSPLTVQESTDFKFSTGQIAYRGSIWAGGNVVSYDGFVRLIKNAVA